MAPSNSKDTLPEEQAFQPWVIEDSWDGAIYLEARLVKTWQGVCGANKLLEDREGHFYWWAVLYAPEGGVALQRIVTFLDWDSLAAELGIAELEGKMDKLTPGVLH